MQDAKTGPHAVPRGAGDGLGLNVLSGHERDSDKSLDELKQDAAAALHPFTLCSILVRAAEATAARANDRIGFEDRLRRAGLNPIGQLRPAFLRRTVTKAICDCDLPDQATGEMNLVDLVRAERAVFDLASGEDVEHLSDADSVVSALQRMYQSQYRDQLHWGYFRRELVLILWAIEAARTEHGIDLDQAWYEAHGLTYRDFAFVSFGFLSQAAASPGRVFGPGEPNFGPRLRVAPEMVSAFKLLCTSTHEEFQERARHPKVRFEDHPLYSLSPLVMWPLVDLGDGELVLPIATDALDRVIGALPFDVRGMLCAADAERFLGCYYRTIEQYVGDSLARSGSFDKVLSGDQVVLRDGQRCDWVGVYRRNALLVEVKSGILDLRAEVTRNMDALRDMLAEDGVADGLIQIGATAAAIRAGDTPVDRRSKLLGLIVLAGDPVMMNDGRVRAMIKDIVREKTGSDPAIDYQIVNRDDFSDLVASCRPPGSMWQFLSKKAQSPRSCTSDISVALGDARGTHPLEDQIRRTFDAMLAEYGIERADLRASRG